MSTPAEAPSRTSSEPSGPALEPRFELAWRDGGGACWTRLVRATSLAGETAAAFALRPAKSFRSFRAEGRVIPPLLYGTVIGGPCLLLNAVAKSLLPGSLDGGPPAFRLSVPVALALLLCIPAIYLFLRAHALHLTLVLTGRTRGSFTATLRLVGYANASVAPLLLLPFAGDFLFLAAGAVVEAISIRFVHGLSPFDAAVAELIPASILALGLLAVLLVAVIWWSQARG